MVLFSLKQNNNSMPNDPTTYYLPESSFAVSSIAVSELQITRQSSTVQQFNRNRKKTNSIKKERQKKEDHLSTIFMGYVVVFIVCHTPRLVLSFYELTEIRRALECDRWV